MLKRCHYVKEKKTVEGNYIKHCVLINCYLRILNYFLFMQFIRKELDTRILSKM